MVDVPDELSASLRCHNGTGGVALDELPLLLDADEITAEYERLVAGVPCEMGSNDQDDPALVSFQTDWIPIQAFGGVWVVFDTSENSRGQLLILCAEETAISVLGSTYTELLAKAAQDVEELVSSVSAEPEPPAWAVFLVQQLCDTGKLELTGKAMRVATQVEDAIERYSSRPRSPRQVADDLLDVLVDSDAVEEVYADANDILQLLADFEAAATP